MAADLENIIYEYRRLGIDLPWKRLTLLGG